MNIIERYSLSMGVPIDNPSICSHYYPIVDRYICVHASNEDNLRSYDYWDIVIELCREILNQNNLKIVQIGSIDDKPIQSDLDLRGKINLRQMSYILQNCELFLGVDSLPIQIAAHFNKPIVALYARSFKECSAPLWGDFSKHKLIEPPRDIKENPSFISNEFPKTINKIKPEEIAREVIELIDSRYELHFKTLFIGNRCKDICVDIIPSQSILGFFDKANIRMDRYHNEKNLAQILSYGPAEVTTSKPFDFNKIPFKNINHINYFAKEFDEEFINQIIARAIPFHLLCSSPKNLSNQRAKLFDKEISLFSEEQIIAENKKKINLDFSKCISDSPSILTYSNKKVVVGGVVYSSLYSLTQKKNDLFLDLDWLYIYTPFYE